MSNELTINCSLVYNKNSISIQESAGGIVSVIGNGLNALSSFTATTTDVAIPVGSSTVAGGWIFIQNLDLTNYVQLETATSGTMIAKLLPGEFCLMRLDASITAPAVKAHTASCLIKFCLFDL
jgi:hypothetical protein